MREIGPLTRASRRRGRPEDGFGVLVRTILGQQLSTGAARTIHARLLDLFAGAGVSPEGLLEVPESRLRACGISRTKATYLRDLARHTADGALPFREMARMSDEEVAERLMAVRGLGRWSADMFLIFHLRRPDVLPVGDLGVRRAVERAYGLPDLPTAQELTEIAAPWRPCRSLASLYLWESLDNPPLAKTVR
ncbi:DNA-3-methyladenine glycosylase family protein [Rubrobacter radiotolerans]|uniref:DNA-3-methyladenine glycosylase II n=1 Tax=Rubrobacter radiotolerans TaxID=42256 RepID=A0AB35T1Y6_RUBRA|nr:DNA-3-methyladenine glycosylase [Rubrobacter radiotolerans]MDX5893859.1 DNA-3-methyladenine glycosylase [Rubrobacter radiotolerans]SMC04634.1 DNA-3-methyladenine glycosylase II [Rubrobacter radiotolerans DSM 5868]